MAFLHRKKRDGLWWLIDKDYKPPKWIKLGDVSRYEARAVCERYNREKTYLRLDLPLPPSEITLGELFEEYLRHAIKGEYTLDRERRLLEHFEKQKMDGKAFGIWPINALEARHVEKYCQAKSYKPNTWHLVAKALRCAYAYAVERKYLPRNPMLEIRLPKIPKAAPRHADPKTIKKVLAEMRGPILHYYRILVYTGMRPAEPLGLRVKDITPEGLMVRQKKTGTFIVYPINPALHGDLKALKAGKSADDWLFPGKDGPQKSMKMGLRRACEAAGVHVSRYTFRHSHATMLLKQTGNLRLVQKALGHARSSTTERYAWVLEEDFQKAVKKFKF